MATSSKRPKRTTVATPSELGAALRSRREEMGLSIVQLAELAGTSRFFVSDLERGKPSVQLDKTLAVLAGLRLKVDLRASALPNRSNAVAAERPRAATPLLPLERAHDEPETIGCAECGASVRNLARHLATAHSMRTSDYRERWALRPGYDLRPRAVAERAARRTLLRSAVQSGAVTGAAVGAEEQVFPESHGQHGRAAAAQIAK